MKQKVRWPFILLVVLAIFVLSACGTSPTEISAPSPDFLISLPRVAIDIDANGVPSILGFNTDQLYTYTLGQVDLRWMRMDPALVEWFTNTDLQHIELLQKEDGLYIFTNGQALPHVAWDQQSLQSIGDLIGDYYPQMQEFLIKFLPFLQRMGWDVVLKFPVAAGATEIPLRDLNQPLAVAAIAQSQPSGIQLKITVTYDEDGVPAVPGAEAMLNKLLGISLNQLALTPQAIQALQTSGIQHIVLRSHNNRLYIFVNGKVLPNLAWDEQGLRNGADLFKQLYYLQDGSTFIDQILDTAIPVLKGVEGNLIFQFPLAPGATPAPLPAAAN